MKHRLKRQMQTALVLGVYLLTTASGLSNPAVQSPTPEQRAQTLIAELTPEERVAQLFLVEFNGSRAEEGSPIWDLIYNYHIGGVVLKAENDNFASLDDLPRSTWTLIQELQDTERDSSQDLQINPATNESFNPAYIPLFVAIAQDGDGPPNDQIFNGLTPLPNSMAIGATWDPERAFEVGEILGRELAALGINLLLGPSLDVIENPRPELAGDLRTGSFGGSPFWVGQLGSSFISGVHQGSQDRMLVAPKHFPGQSGSERPPEEEIPSVRKTLEQLRQVELVPYFAVTSQAGSPESVADALLMTHAKFQAFQGNITPTTRPISFDPQAFEQLMSLPEFESWYEDGGLIISDELGSRAVRRYFDPLESQIDARLVARDAFLAGNDLLLTGGFLSDQAPNSHTVIIETLEFFTQKYREDVAFAQRVDSAALRILTQKFRLYNNFLISAVRAPALEADTFGAPSQITFDIARLGATLLSPSAENLAIVLPDPPALGQRIVTITDTYWVEQCRECTPQLVIQEDALRQAIVRLYGPAGGELILPQYVTAHSFGDLMKALNTDEPEENTLLQELRSAEWVVFLQQDVDTETRPDSEALGRLLLERPDLIQQKNVIVFSLNAPYFLDATGISKLTAYYGLYSKQPENIEIAARLLFKELTAPGDSPVSVPGIGYVLSEALAPDSEQAVTLSVQPANLPALDEDGPTPEPITEYRVGESILIETSPVLDQNGNPIPDSTTIHFSLTTTTIEGATNQREINTFSDAGIGRVNIILDTAGSTEILATSGDPPATSDAFLIDVAAATGSEPITSTPGSENGEQSTGEATPGEIQQPPPAANLTTLGDWFLTLLVTGFISLFAYQMGANSGQVRWGIRWMLTAIIGGLFVNTYLSLDLPGAARLIQELQLWGLVGSTAIGALLGWLIGYVWRRRSK